MNNSLKRTKVERNIPPELITEWMKRVLPSLNISELTGMFIGLKKEAPVLEHMSQVAEKSLNEERWASVKARTGL